VLAQQEWLRDEVARSVTSPEAATPAAASASAGAAAAGASGGPPRPPSLPSVNGSSGIPTPRSSAPPSPRARASPEQVIAEALAAADPYAAAAAKARASPRSSPRASPALLSAPSLRENYFAPVLPPASAPPASVAPAAAKEAPGGLLGLWQQTQVLMAQAHSSLVLKPMEGPPRSQRPSEPGPFDALFCVAPRPQSAQSGLDRSASEPATARQRDE
jgi:hypothetical protein